MEKVKSKIEGNTLIVERSFSAPRELVFEAFSDADGHINPELPVMTITNEFVDIPNGTLLISSSEFTDNESLQRVVEMGVVEGFSSQLERLDAIVSR